MAMVGAAISATSEVVGMATGAGSMAQTSHLYKGQLAQTKCYFAAGWAEASWRHAEALNQAERHHLDDSALGRAAIHQTEKIHQREMDSDARKDIVVNHVHPGYVDTDMTRFANLE